MHRVLGPIIVLLLIFFISSCEFEGSSPAADVDDIVKDDYLPQPDEFVPVEVYPTILGCDSLVYPLWRPEWGTMAIVWVKVLVGKDGDVLGVLIGKSSGFHELDHAAIENAATCEFKPGIQNGRPVAVWVTFQIKFTPPDSAG